MLKILHTADWHLGKKLDRFSRHEEQVDVLDEICKIADSEGVHAVIIAGDLYDTYNPPAESIELFYKTLKRLSSNGKRAVIAIAGNHDSPERIEAPDPLARECGILFSGFPQSKLSLLDLPDGIKVSKSDDGFVELVLPDVNFPLRILLTPYANEFRLKTYLGEQDSEEELRDLLRKHWKKIADEYCDSKGINILVAHLFMMTQGEEKPQEPDDEKPILHVGGAQEIYTSSIPEQMHYAALGHLHRNQTVGNKPCPAVYSSSPLSYSFAEAEQDKYVVIIEANPGESVRIHPHQLEAGRPLKRGRFESLDEAKRWLLENQEAYVEVTIVTDKYLDGQARKSLADVHERIIDVIPEMINSELESVSPVQINQAQDFESLFIDYFKYKKQTDPPLYVLDLLKEVQSIDETEQL